MVCRALDLFVPFYMSSPPEIELKKSLHGNSEMGQMKPKGVYRIKIFSLRKWGRDETKRKEKGSSVMRTTSHHLP